MASSPPPPGGPASAPATAASATAAHVSLAGRLRSKFRRSERRQQQLVDNRAAGAAVAADTEEEEEEPPGEGSDLPLHPDLDDCAELSELLLPEDTGQGRTGQANFGSAEEPGVEIKALQAQLMALAIENEALRSRAGEAESELVRDLRRQLEAERLMRRRAEVVATDAAAVVVAAKPAGPLSRAVARLRRRRHAAASTPAAAAAAVDATVPDGVELESLDSDSDAAEGTGSSVEPELGCRASLTDRCKSWIVGRLLDLMEDLQPDDGGAAASAAAQAEAEEERHLSARRLKANVTRCGRNARPLLRCLDGAREVLRWRSPSYTFVVAMTYYLALRCDLLLSLLLLLCIARLGLNYLKYRRHWSFQFNFLADYDTSDQDEASEKDRTVGTQVNLVVHVAKKVQNFTGKLSDTMEKLKNLITWRSPRHTQSLVNALTAALAVSLVLPTSSFLYCSGIYIGVKLLLIDALFARYPRLKRRYDRVARLWESLPTDRQLGIVEPNRDVAKYILPQSDGEPDKDGDQASGGSPLASDDEQFCQAFALPNPERPLARWRGGKRCAIVCKDAERTLPLPSSLKHGKLFLTRSFLCFERSKDRGKAGRRRNLVIPLAMVRWARKAKPFAWFPGSGMAIEVRIVGLEKAITFGAMIGRDEAFESLTEAGRKAGLAWAGGSDAGGQQQEQQPDPQLVKSISQALLSDSDLED